MKTAKGLQVLLLYIIMARNFHPLDPYLMTVSGLRRSYLTYLNWETGGRLCKEIPQGSLVTWSATFHIYLLVDLLSEPTSTFRTYFPTDHTRDPKRTRTLTLPLHENLPTS